MHRIFVFFVQLNFEEKLVTDEGRIMRVEGVEGLSWGWQSEVRVG